MKLKLIPAILVCVVGVTIGYCLPSCTITPERQAAFESLTDLGVEYGAIEPGTAILIKKSTVIVSNLLKKEPAKEIPLAGSPVEDAVKEGHVAPGETIVTHDGVNATVIPPVPSSTPEPNPPGS